MRISPAKRALLVWGVGAVLSVGPLSAQRQYSVAEISDGGELFQANCATCHGADGAAVPGVDLGHGQFRRAASDDDLVQIIRGGIPGTAMPPGNFSGGQASTIVAYLRSLEISALNNAVPGDAVQGKAVFEGKGACASCHRVNGNGSRLGPDLSDIGIFRRAAEIEHSLVDPGAEIQPQNRMFRVVTRDGTTVTGRLLNHDSFTVQLIDSREQLRSFAKASLRDYAFVDSSPMPSYRDKLSARELADVIRYLVSLKGVKANP